MTLYARVHDGTGRASRVRLEQCRLVPVGRARTRARGRDRARCLDVPCRDASVLLECRHRLALRHRTRRSRPRARPRGRRRVIRSRSRTAVRTSTSPRSASASSSMRNGSGSSTMRRPRRAASRTAAGWRRLTTPEELVRFEDAWRAHGSPATTRVFLPALLADEIGCVPRGRARRRDRRGRRCQPLDACRGALELLRGWSRRSTPGSRAPWRRFAGPRLDLPVVGYESGESLARARREGFRAAGALRIWILEP